MQYRREIDGLRALAILPVILFHDGFPIFSYAYIGVDVFFIISGYLITSIIVEKRKNEHFSVARTGFSRRTPAPDAFVESQRLLCRIDDNGCPAFTSVQQLISFDDNHLTPWCAAWAGRFLFQNKLLASLNQ